MILAYQNAIPTKLMADIRERANAWLDCNKENKFNTAYNRVGDTIVLELHSEFLDLDGKIKDFLQEFIKEVVLYRYKPDFPVGDSGFEYHRYNPGDMCFPHTDGETAFKPGESTSLLRFATIIMHLNTVEHGGETIFPMQNKTFKAIEGQILLFPPYNMYPHYVTPTPERREILMTWLVYSGINVIR